MNKPARLRIISSRRQRGYISQVILTGFGCIRSIANPQDHGLKPTLLTIFIGC